jgi:hypothetical protein
MRENIKGGGAPQVRVWSAVFVVGIRVFVVYYAPFARRRRRVAAAEVLISVLFELIVLELSPDANHRLLTRAPKVEPPYSPNVRRRFEERVVLGRRKLWSGIAHGSQAPFDVFACGGGVQVQRPSERASVAVGTRFDALTCEWRDVSE